MENEEDWLQGVAVEFRQVAKRHGKELFPLVMQAGAASYALHRIASRTRGNAEMHQAIGILGGILEGFCAGALIGIGKTQQDFEECRKEVEIIGQLQAATRQSDPLHTKRSPGGIILDS